METIENLNDIQNELVQPDSTDQSGIVQLTRIIQQVHQEEELSHYLMWKGKFERAHH